MLRRLLKASHLMCIIRIYKCKRWLARQERMAFAYTIYQGRMSRRDARTSGDRPRKVATSSSAAASRLLSTQGSSASRINRTRVVESLIPVREHWRQFQRRQVTPAFVTPHNLSSWRMLCKFSRQLQRSRTLPGQ